MPLWLCMAIGKSHVCANARKVTLQQMGKSLLSSLRKDFVRDLKIKHKFVRNIFFPVFFGIVGDLIWCGEAIV